MKLDRHKLADSDFALPSQRAYPIPDQLHARLAIGDALKWAGSEERKQIAKAIKKRYPDLRAQANDLAAMRDAAGPRPTATKRKYRTGSSPAMDEIVTEH